MNKKSFYLIAVLCLILAGCKKSDIPAAWGPVVGVNGEWLGKVQGIPEGVTFDRIAVEVSGFDWQTIITVEAPVQKDTAILILPSSFAQSDLQPVDRGPAGKNMEGHWPSNASDPEALVATLREEIIAWQGDRKVGRVYLTGNPETDPLYIGYQFADRPFVLNGFTGRNNAFVFTDVAFSPGWNLYAKLNASTSTVRIKTDIQKDTEWVWRFEAWP
jgi:hypothetical protein